MGEYSSLGRAVFILLICIAAAAYYKSQGIRQSKESIAVLASIILLGASFFIYAGVDRTIAKYNIARYEKGILKMMGMKMMGTLGDGALPEIYRLWKKEQSENNKQSFDMAELLRNIPAEYSWDCLYDSASESPEHKVRVYFVNNKVDYVF